MKRAGTRPGERNPKTLSPKAVEIVRLVDALSASHGSHDGIEMGRGIGSLLRDAYSVRGKTIPRWVQELMAYYARAKRAL